MPVNLEPNMLDETETMPLDEAAAEPKAGDRRPARVQRLTVAEGAWLAFADGEADQLDALRAGAAAVVATDAGGRAARPCGAAAGAAA
jgi:hypothetical protein